VGRAEKCVRDRLSSLSLSFEVPEIELLAILAPEGQKTQSSAE